MTTDDSRRSSAASPSIVLAGVAGFIAWCSLLDWVSPVLLERFVAGAQAAGVTGSALGVLTFMVFGVVPWTLAIAGAWAVQVRVKDRDRQWLLQLPFLALFLVMPPRGDEIAGVLPPSAAVTYRMLDGWALGVMVAGLAVWTVYRVIRWLVRDERAARASAR